MSNIIRDALEAPSTIPTDSETTHLCTCIAEFIKKYRVFLKNEKTISIAILITNRLGGYTIILAPPNENYGKFSLTFDTSFGGEAIANLLTNIGANVTFDSESTKRDERFEHYLVKFNIPN